jgi:hypothetical protein
MSSCINSIYLKKASAAFACLKAAAVSPPAALFPIAINPEHFGARLLQFFLRV